TKGDLAAVPSTALTTSAVTGQGIEALKGALFDAARTRAPTPMASSLSRCQHHVDACLNHIRQAHSIVLNDDPPEMLAVELRSALEQLGEMTGAVFTDEL